MTTYAEIARDLTPREIAARQKVWQAFMSGDAVELTAAECGALWTSILQTGKELSWYREQLPVATARLDPVALQARLDELAEGDSNDAEIDGLRDIIDDLR